MSAFWLMSLLKATVSWNYAKKTLTDKLAVEKITVLKRLEVEWQI